MFKREMKVNLKSFLIWLAVLLGIFFVAYLMYPSIISSENVTMMDEMMQMFPEEIIKALNMDISSMDTAYGWLKTEGFVMVLLIIGCYAGVLGSNILLKEESENTIEYLNSLPISRNKIVCSKVLTGMIYIVLMILILGIFNYIGLELSGDFDKKQFLLLSITPLFSSLVIYFSCLFFSTWTNKTKKMTGVSLAIVMVSYFFQVLSTMADKVEFLKVFSVFTLADIRNVITDIAINPFLVLVSFCLCFFFFILTLLRYNKKELV